MANNSNTNDLTKGFEIYLHEKDQFWPGMEMEHIGQTKSLYIPTKTEVWGSFTAVRKINIAKKSAPCVTDPSYSYTRCMLTHLATTVGCHLDWVSPAAGQPPCLTWDQVLSYNSALGTVRSALSSSFHTTQSNNLLISSKLSWTQMVNVTGCQAKCHYTEFSFNKVCAFRQYCCI